MDIDLYLASAVVRDGTDGLMALRRAGVTPEIVYGSGKAIIEFIDDFFKKYGEVPKPTLIEQGLGIDLPEIEEPVDYFIDQVLERRVFNLGKKLSVKLAESLEGGRPYEAVDAARGYVKDAVSVGSGGKVVSLSSLLSAVREEYLEAKSGKRGILTPWPGINKLSLGFKPGDLVVVAGRLGTGKTYLLMLMADKAWAQDKRVLVVCTEMTKEQIAARVVAIRFRVPYGLLREGKLSYPIEKRLFEKMEDLSNDDSFMLIGDDFDINLDAIEAAIEQAQPDIVFVDGLYLVKTKSKVRDRYTAVAEIADELKRMARRHRVPIVASTQFNRDVSANDVDNIRAEHLAMSDTIGWNCLLPDSLIYTVNGMVPLGSLSGSVDLVVPTGSDRGVVVGPTRKNVTEVEFDTGMVFRCSPEHRIFVLRGLSLEPVMAKNCKPGDTVPIQVGFACGDDNLAGFYGHKDGYNTNISIPPLWSEDLAEVLGLAIGDAYIAQDNSWEFAVDPVDKDLTDILLRKIFSVFGYNAPSKDRRIRGGTADMVYINSVKIIEFLRWLGAGRHLSNTKRVPARLWSATERIRRAFLRGLFEADGSVSKRGNIELTTVSRFLAQGVLRLLLSVGVSSVVRTAAINQARDGGYRLRMDMRNSCLFMERVGFLSKRKKMIASSRIRMPSIKTRIIPPGVATVVSVRVTDEIVDMFDVVGTSSGAFIADGVLVHNSDMLLGLYQTDDMREDRELGIRLMKMRESAIGNDVIIRWDFESMEFDEIDGETDVYTDDEFAEIEENTVVNDNKDDLPF